MQDACEGPRDGTVSAELYLSRKKTPGDSRVGAPEVSLSLPFVPLGSAPLRLLIAFEIIGKYGG
jgi:hypothetical protein